jgi:hypothetical protein
MEERKIMNEKCLTICKEVKDTWINGRLISELFIDLPDKTLYQHYFLLIKKPISINIILRKLQYCEYENARQFHNDFSLLFSNAFEYNADGMR